MGLMDKFKSTYGGLATSEMQSMAKDELSKVKEKVLEGTLEMSVIGLIGSILMALCSIFALVSDLLYLSPIRALVSLYCLLGALALISLELIHRHSLFFASIAKRLSSLRIYLYQEMHFLATLSGRSVSYFVFGTLLIANSRSWIGRIVGIYLVLLAFAQLYIAHTASTKLNQLGDGFSESELSDKFKQFADSDGKLNKEQLKSLCKELGHDLSSRELDATTALLDTDQSGTIDQNEFLAWWKSSNWQRSLLSRSGPPLPGTDLIQHMT
mmetsp:Transcript_24188/g.31470  ORF Transcript_24188/g.31470 Transcript_24188/m.31470 type:complete len:269 (+) Transcript_24188:1801-2607(+)